jgi:hypothetical protein
MPPKKAINAREEDNRTLDEVGEHNTASKTQGSLPSAQQTSPAKGAANEPAIAAGQDKEVAQSMCMASSG